MGNKSDCFHTYCNIPRELILSWICWFEVITEHEEVQWSGKTAGTRAHAHTRARYHPSPVIQCIFCSRFVFRVSVIISDVFNGFVEPNPNAKDIKFRAFFGLIISQFSMCDSCCDRCQCFYVFENVPCSYLQLLPQWEQKGRQGVANKVWVS